MAAISRLSSHSRDLCHERKPLSFYRVLSGQSAGIPSRNMRTFTMKRLAFAGALGLLTSLSVGQAYAQMDSLGNTGLGDARAQNLPTSIGVNNGYRGQGYGYGYGTPVAGAGYVTGPTAFRGRSAYVRRHSHRHPARHW
jgi:hypothetical protein